MNIFGMTCAEVAAEMSRRYGRGEHHAVALYREIFKKGCLGSFENAPEFRASPALTRRLARDVRTPDCAITGSLEDGVLKFTAGLHDGNGIESVIIPARSRATLCVSSQAGCRMGCGFCATGMHGFVRSLSAEEIVWQVYAARHILKRHIDNIVFMGMGEPFDNFDNVIRAIRVMGDQRGLDIALSHVTISTAGHADGIKKLAEAEMPGLRLAVSINAADDKVRGELMPINKKYPLGILKKSLLAFPLRKKGVFFIEYVLLSGINDSREMAGKLALYLKGLPVRVNVITYNGGASLPYSPPSGEQVKRFCDRLVEENIFVRKRQSYGRDILAGCGQLVSTRPSGHSGSAAI
ncbi:MAG: 23S rRNA (adenine(2503)-C(2))-methyltransferase RlmN [Chitinivibrionales bacterium]